MSSVARLTSWTRRLVRSSILRLTLLLSMVFAVGMAVAIILATTFGRDAVLQRVDAALVELARTVAADETPADTASVIIRPLSDLGTLPRAFARVAAGGGGTVDLEDDYRRSEAWRVLVARDARGTEILIALPLDDSDDALELLSGILWATAGVVLIVAIAIGLAAGLVSQRRLIRVNRTLTRLAEGDLQARTGIDRSRDDLDDLARDIDSTAAALERLVAQTRNLSASLAHDLRTPVARLRARLEKLPGGEERTAALVEAERLSGIFDTIMRVARIEAGHGTDGFEAVELGELLVELEETFGAVVEDSGKRLIAISERAGTVFADRRMLIQAMANLIQNAILHGGPDITLFVREQEIGVADNGDGVDPTHYAEIVKPMVRLDTARESDGTGLGLALVRAVADRHGARLTLTDNQPKGLRVALKFTKM